MWYLFLIQKNHLAFLKTICIITSCRNSSDYYHGISPDDFQLFFYVCGGQSAGLFCCAFYRGYYKKGNKMNLKEKWTKQNNSVKMLLRKLKRHDTVVVAIAVVIAVILCGGLIYLSTPVVAASAKDELAQAQSEDNQQTIEKLDELSEYLNGLDKTVTESRDSINNLYEKDSADKLLGEKSTEKMTNTVTEKVGNLGKEFSNMHDTISRTESDIEKLKELIEKSDADSGKAISESFTNIYNNLEEIENTYNKSQESTKELMEQIKEAMKSGDDKLSKELLESYQELLEKLKESDSKLSDQNSENLTSFKNEITSLNQQITDKLDKMSLEMNSGVANLNSSIDNHFNSMSTTFQGDMSDLRGYLDGKLSGINDDLQKVFTLVGDGKRLLASTLLTKGVEVKEDATFKEIAKAIENIPVQIVLDKDDVPGEVIYQYHYHEDGQGTVCDEEYVPIDRQGGCYTEAYVHTHTAECYKVSYVYTYSTKKDVENRGHSHDDWEGHANNRYHCNYCGANFVNDNPYHEETTTSKAVADSRSQGYRTDREIKTLICTKPEGQLLGYRTTCNLVHGQIVAAKIVFADGYDKYNTETGAYKPQNTETTLLTTQLRTIAPDNELWNDFDAQEPIEDESDFFSPKEAALPSVVSQELNDDESDNIKEEEDNNDKQNDKDGNNDKDLTEVDSDSGSSDDSSDGSADSDVTASETVEETALLEEGYGYEN